MSFVKKISTYSSKEKNIFYLCRNKYIMPTNRILKKTFFICLIYCLTILPVTAQTSVLYSTENQISSSLINDIYQDRKGFIWIATEYGLNLFDGNKFVTFHHSVNDPTSLLNDYVYSIFEDSKNNLWIASLGGLLKYDHNTNSFVEVPLYMNSKRITTMHTVQIIERKNGEIWIASSGGGVFKADKEGKRCECVMDFYKRGILHLSSILEDNNGNIWAGAENDGLICYNPETQAIQIFRSPSISENNISDLAQDKNGNIYIGTLTGGLNVYYANTKNLVQIPYKGRYDLQIKTLKYIDNLLYIGTDGEGLKFYSSENNEITDYSLENVPININDGKVHSILIDRDKNLWLGLFQRGIAFIPMKRNPFLYHGRKQIYDNPIGHNCVMSVFQNHNKELFVGTDNDGLYVLDKDFKQIHHFRPGEAANGVTNTILSIFQDSDNELWLGSYTKGVARCNPANGLCEYIPELINERVFSITEDHHHNLYFSTYGSGFYVYNKDSKALKRYNCIEESAEKSKDELPNNWINTLYCDREGMIWIGHFKGISCFNPDTESFINYTSNNYVIKGCLGYAITESHDGTIWAGTSNGLYSFDRKTKEIKRYTQQDGLSNNIICGVCEDNNHHIWVSTFNGISCLNRQTQHFTTFFSGDGLQGNEFTRGAFYRSTSGEIFFGGINGITSFIPEQIAANAPTPSISITEFVVSGKTVNTNTLSGGKQITPKAVIESDKFRLNYKDNTFSISFSTLQFDNARQIVYKYRIKELDEEWLSTTPGVNTVTYNNLPHGKYTFQVYAINHGNNSPIRSISIIITPPWFQSWWAYVIYTLLIILIVLAVIGNLRARFQRRKEMIERKHAEEIGEAKLQFFINISHEIRTPLTLIINPLEKLIANCHDSELGKSYIMIYRNSQRILRLINQLMDIRKIDKGQMQLKFRETDLVGFIDDVVNTFSYLAQDKHITLTFQHQDNKLNAWLDLHNFDKVLMNLLSNAFKYTPEGGSVTVSLTTGEDEEAHLPLKKYIEIKVADTGIGLDDQQIGRIFDRFYQISNDITRNQAGTGVGLHLTRSLVELHHGTIIARNRLDTQGSEFIIRIPQGSDHLKMEDLEQPDTTMETENAPTVAETKQPIKTMGEDEEEEKKVKAKNNFHILIADDEKEILNYLKSELSGNYKIHTCNNGRDAYEYLLNNPTDLLISDVMMPEMDGITLCKKIKQNANINHIPVILLTAKGRPEEQVEGIEIGADSYLVKPFNMEVLRSTIGNLLQNRRWLKNKFSGAQEQTDKVQKIQLKSADEVLMNKIMKVINENLSEPTLNVEMLANSVGLSRVHLHRKLKELTNLSSRDFIRNIRMQQAAKLLKEKKLSISDVAYAVGYNNLSHFSNTFKECFGLSPKEYMQNAHEENAAEPNTPQE